MPAPRNIRNRSKKFDKNITKRGNVDPGKVADREEEGPRIDPKLIVFFLVLVVGSSLVSVLNMFFGGGGRNKPPVDAEEASN